MTTDAFLHLFEVTEADKDLLHIHGRHDLRNFCDLLDHEVDLEGKKPFITVDVKNAGITPIFIPASRVLMKAHNPNARHHDHKSKAHDGTTPVQHRQNAFYVCRHINPPKKKNVRLIGDFCLWASTKQSSLKWLMAMGDPLAAKSTYDVASSGLHYSEMELADQSSIESGGPVPCARILERGISADSSTVESPVDIDIGNIMTSLSRDSSNTQENSAISKTNFVLPEGEELDHFSKNADEVEANRRAQEEEDEVERLLALEAEEEERVRAAAAAALNDINMLASQDEEENKLHELLALAAADELEEEERAKLQDLMDEEHFNATLTEEEKEENRRAQEEEDEVERLLALEAEEEERERAAAAAALNNNSSAAENKNGITTPESVKARRSLVQGVSEYVCSRLLIFVFICNVVFLVF